MHLGQKPCREKNQHFKTKAETTLHKKISKLKSKKKFRAKLSPMIVASSVQTLHYAGLSAKQALVPQPTGGSLPPPWSHGWLLLSPRSQSPMPQILFSLEITECPSCHPTATEQVTGLPEIWILVSRAKSVKVSLQLKALQIVDKAM